MADNAPRKKVTINTLKAKMAKGEPITQLAAYDYRTAVGGDRCDSAHAFDAVGLS